MVVHGTPLTITTGAEALLTSTVLLIESIPITTNLPWRPCTVTVSLCSGTRLSRVVTPRVSHRRGENGICSQLDIPNTWVWRIISRHEKRPNPKQVPAAAVRRANYLEDRLGLNVHRLRLLARKSQLWPYSS